jgi:hypothetical protein
MPQIITKYNSGPLGISEAADATLDPKSAFRYFVDFISDKEDDEFVTTSSANAATFALTNDHGGAFTIATAATANGDHGIVASPADFIVLDGGRFVYFEARVQVDSLSSSWVVGLSADAPATSEWSTSAIAPGSAAILVGRDAGTDSITGAVANKSLQLSTWADGTAGHVETLIPLDITLAVNTYYRIGFVVQGWTVQVYVNGKKYGNPVKMSSAVTTAMGVYCGIATTSAAARTMKLDYIDAVCTR